MISVFDLHKELLQMQENYHNNPLEDIGLRCPSWLDFSDPMSELYANKARLLKEGKVVYANIVQANSYLFMRLPPFNYPAHIVYSTEPYFAEHPDALQEIAWKLFKYKDLEADEIPDEWKKVAAVIADEYDRSAFEFSLNVDGQNITYHFIPTMIHRKLLPKRILNGSLLPVLALPDCKQVMILPKKYWTKEFTRAWIAGFI